MIAGITVNNGHQFTPGQFLAMGQQRGLDAASKSAITGFITKEDDIGTVESLSRIHILGFLDAGIPHEGRIMAVGADQDGNGSFGDFFPEVSVWIRPAVVVS